MVCCAFCWLLNLCRKLIQGRIECEFRISGHNPEIWRFRNTGETIHWQYFDNALKQWSPPSGPCGLCELFPNVYISLRIFLTIPASVASAERFFSKLKLVKKYLRSAMSQTRLDLARLNIELPDKLILIVLIGILRIRIPENHLYNS